MFDYISFYRFLGLILLTPLLRTRKYLDIYILPLYVYAVVSSNFPYHPNKIPIPMLVGMEGQQNLFIAMLLGFVLLIKSNLDSRKIYTWLGIAGIVNVVFYLLFYPIVKPHIPMMPAFLMPVMYAFKGLKLNEASWAIDWEISSLIPNRSMAGVLNLALLPFSLGVFKNNKFALLFILLSLGLIPTYKSTSVLMAASLMLVCVMYHAKDNLVLSNLILFIALIAAIPLVPDLFQDGLRFTLYKLFFSGFTWKEWLMGKGPATFMAWGPVIQHKARISIENGYWIYMHSDILQHVFENGLALTGLMFVSGINLLMRANVAQRLSLSAIIGASIFYYPFRFGAHLIVMALILKCVIDNSEYKDG